MPLPQAGQAGMSVLDIDTAGLYRPRTKETREAYEALLSVVQGQFGDQPQVRIDAWLNGGERRCDWGACSPAQVAGSVARCGGHVCCQACTAGSCVAGHPPWCR
jgi:hypothetical protein